MKYFAVLNEDVVVNIIHADSLEVAEKATNAECIEYTVEQGCGNGWIYNRERGVLSPPQIYPSWTLNEETNRWEAPVAYPEFGIHAWDEKTLSWVAM